MGARTIVVGRGAKRRGRGGAAWAIALAAVLAAGCGGGKGDPPAPTPTPDPSATPAPDATPTPTPADPPPSTVAFSPDPIYLDNPTAPGETTTAASIAVGLAAYGRGGQPIAPSDARPLHVTLVGAPPGVVTPTEATIASGATFTFEYDGSYFPNPIAFEAWMEDGDGGAAIGRMQLLQRNPIECDYGRESYDLPIHCERDDGVLFDCSAEEAIASGLWVRAAVGYESPAASDFHGFQIDTGSLGVVVPKDELGPDAIGPAGPASQIYDTTGLVYTGHYYLAPVSFELASGVLTTNRIMVLGIDGVHCAPDYPDCKPPPSPDLHYLGVRFANGDAGGNAFDSPLDNAFLQAIGGASGTEVSPGWILTGDTATLGLTGTAGFDLVALQPNPTQPGEWSASPGCFAFPGLDPSTPFCGSLLIDVGIKDMVLDLPAGLRPSGSYETVGNKVVVPPDTAMQVLAGSPGAAALSYAFEVGTVPADSPAPTAVSWGPFPTMTFVNTGRRALFAADYLFDARCGHVGFRPRSGS